MNIAVVEDSDFDVAIYRSTFLKNVEFDVFMTFQEFENRTQEYDVVILDLNLPDKWGLPLVDAVKKTHKGKLVVITGTASGYLRGKNVRDIMDKGVDELFEKNSINDKAYCDMISLEVLGKKLDG